MIGGYVFLFFASQRKSRPPPPCHPFFFPFLVFFCCCCLPLYCIVLYCVLYVTAAIVWPNSSWCTGAVVSVLCLWVHGCIISGKSRGSILSCCVCVFFSFDFYSRLWFLKIVSNIFHTSLSLFYIYTMLISSSFRPFSHVTSIQNCILNYLFSSLLFSFTYTTIKKNVSFQFLEIIV